MAIIIEEEKKKSSTGALVLLGWFVIVITIAIAAYYLFFATPTPVTVAPPAGFTNLQPLSKITATPQDVAGNPSFQSLRATIASPASSSPAGVGRTNPFVTP